MIVSALEREEGEERWRETQKESEREGEMTVSRERWVMRRTGLICEFFLHLSIKGEDMSTSFKKNE